MDVSPTSVTLDKDGSETFSATYARDTATVNIEVEPDEASWILSDGDSNMTPGTGNATLPNIPTGAIELTWQPLEFFDPPAENPMNKALERDGSILFRGDYTTHTGTINIREPLKIHFLLRTILSRPDRSA